jgi:hypothetical protein
MEKNHHRKICRKHCPLAQAGLECLKPDSAWKKLDGALSGIYEDNLDLSYPPLTLKDHPELSDLCMVIYGALCDLLPRFDPYIRAKELKIV